MNKNQEGEKPCEFISAEEAVSISLKFGTIETLSIVHEVAAEYKKKAPVYDDSNSMQLAC